jgi:hypothetical protein
MVISPNFRHDVSHEFGFNLNQFDIFPWFMQIDFTLSSF